MNLNFPELFFRILFIFNGIFGGMEINLTSSFSYKALYFNGLWLRIL